MITKNGKAAYMHYMAAGKQAERDKKAGAGWKNMESVNTLCDYLWWLKGNTWQVLGNIVVI